MIAGPSTKARAQLQFQIAGTDPLAIFRSYCSKCARRSILKYDWPRAATECRYLCSTLFLLAQLILSPESVLWVSWHGRLSPTVCGVHTAHDVRLFKLFDVTRSDGATKFTFTHRGCLRRRKKVDASVPRQILPRPHGSCILCTCCADVSRSVHTFAPAVPMSARPSGKKCPD